MVLARFLPLFGFFLLGLPIFSVAQTQEYREVRVLVDVDQALVEKSGSVQKAEQFVRELIARVDAIYRSQLGLTVTLAGIHIWTSEDPFVRNDQSVLLASFSSYAEANYRGVYQYDAAQLLVGTALGGAGGVAYQGSACGDPSNAPQAYGVSQPDLTDVYEFNAHLFSHELGHNLNADHDSLPACALNNIMCLGQIGAQFSEASKLSIAGYVATRQSSGCFPSVVRSDPATPIRIKATVLGGAVKYRVTNAGACQVLTLVGAPSPAGLKALFGYLQLGKLTPGDSIQAISRSAVSLKGVKPGKLFIGAYCNGQLAPNVSVLAANKIKSRLVTPSAPVALRALQRTFKVTAN